MCSSGPLGSGGAETKRPKGARAGCTRVFANSRMNCREPRLRLTNPAKPGANAGCRFFWFGFLWTSKENELDCAEGDVESS